MSVSGAAITGMPVERRTHGSVSMVMVLVAAISIMQANLTEHALDFLAERFGNQGSLTLSAGDAADVGRIDVELNRDALVEAAKNGEHLYRVRDTIRVVTVHDFLVQTRRSDPASTMTTLTRMVSLIG
jgi:hypothetical protein